MIQNKLRLGNATSSKASVLMVRGNGDFGFGEGAITYAKEKAMERILLKSVDSPVQKRELLWGKFMEKMLFLDHKKVGINYALQSVDTAVHPKYKFWAGSVDFISDLSAGESKSFYLKNHILLCLALLSGDVNRIKKEYASIYWQVTSNAEIHKRNYCDIFAYCPTYDDLQKIRSKYDDAMDIQTLMNDDPWRYQFIIDDEIELLQFIPKGSRVPSFVKFRFEKSPEDVVALTKRMIDFDKLVDKYVKEFQF